MATAAGAVRAAFKTMMVTAIADTAVQIEVGYPWPQTSADIVSVGRVVVGLEPGPMGPQRSRDETITVEVLISVFRPGGQEQEEIASARAYELLDAVEHHTRMVDQTLGGLVQSCLLTGHELDSAPFSDDTGQGRTVEVLATFEAKNRVRN